MSDQDWKSVARALLGTWPQQVATWGQEGVAAYIAELAARGLTPDAALFAIRTYDPDADFPPSVAKLAAQARRDPSVPTFDEAYRLIFGPGGVLAARPAVRRWADDGQRRRLFNDAAMRRAEAFHPLIGAFVARQGLERLRQMPVDDPDQGHWRRRELQQAWQEHVDASAGREVAVLAAGAGGEGLRRLDPLTGIDRPRQQLPEGVTR